MLRRAALRSQETGRTRRRSDSTLRDSSRSDRVRRIVHDVDPRTARRTSRPETRVARKPRCRAAGCPERDTGDRNVGGPFARLDRCRGTHQAAGNDADGNGCSGAGQRERCNVPCRALGERRAGMSVSTGSLISPLRLATETGPFATPMTAWCGLGHPASRAHGPHGRHGVGGDAELAPISMVVRPSQRTRGRRARGGERPCSATGFTRYRLCNNAAMARGCRYRSPAATVRTAVPKGVDRARLRVTPVHRARVTLDRDRAEVRRQHEDPCRGWSATSAATSASVDERPPMAISSTTTSGRGGREG